MGHIFATLQLSNPCKPQLQGVTLKALADTGSLLLCLPEHVAIQLEVGNGIAAEVSEADGRAMTVPYVGPVKVVFENSMCYVGALVLGDEILLGAVPMADMDLVLSPS